MGFSDSPGSGYEAFRWENDQMDGLENLPGGFIGSLARDVSDDGSVIVGTNFLLAFIWDEDNGIRNLRDVLVNDCGLDLTGWTLHDAWGISADGLTIVGSGVNPDGYFEGWIATIPEPVSVLLFALGGLILRRKINR